MVENVKIKMKNWKKGLIIGVIIVSAQLIYIQINIRSICSRVMENYEVIPKECEPYTSLFNTVSGWLGILFIILVPTSIGFIVDKIKEHKSSQINKTPGV